MPDAEGRGRLIRLYGEGLDLRLRQPDELVEALDNTSAAFIRELLRRAALLAAEQSDDSIVVTDAELWAALSELQSPGNELTGTLLGAPEPDTSDPS